MYTSSHTDDFHQIISSEGEVLTMQKAIVKTFFFPFPPPPPLSLYFFKQARSK